MADNTTLNPGTGGDVIDTDDVAGVKIQRVKIGHGLDGAAPTSVSTASPLPVLGYGTTEGGNYVRALSSDEEGHLEVSIQEPATAFGEVSTAETTWLAQVLFSFGVNTHTTTAAVTGSGVSATESGGLASLSTSATATSSSQLISKRNCPYRPGQGVVFRTSALFTTGAANSKQYAGCFDDTFQNGFGFGYNGTSFGIVSITGGTETWVAKSSWNYDPMAGGGGSTNPSGQTLDPTKLNIYQIKFQFLGAGGIDFFVENATNSQLVKVHGIRYPNANTVPSLAMPILRVAWRVANTTNATAIILKIISGAIGVDGKVLHLGPNNAASSGSKSITASTLTNLLSIRNATTYNGKTNRSCLRIRDITWGTNTGGAVSGVAFLTLYKGATVAGVPVFNTIAGTTGDNGVTITSGQSTASYDVAGTTVSGVTLATYITMDAIGNGKNLSLIGQDIFIAPGETLTFQIDSGQNVTAGCAVSWSEDL